MIQRTCFARPLTKPTVCGVLLMAVGCAASQAPQATTPSGGQQAVAVAPAPSNAATSAAVPAQVVQTIVTRVEAKPDSKSLSSLPELPRPSPNATVTQDVGISQVRVEYSSPGVKGRTVWGALVPYGKLWRTGANSPTKLVVDHDFTFGGVPVPAGSYSLMTLPAPAKWTFILNPDPTNQGAFGHDPKLDVALIEVSPSAAPPRERLAFMFDGTTEDRTELVLNWAGLRVAVPITVDTKKHVAESVASTVENAWRPLFNAGRHAFASGDNAGALDLLNRSVAVSGTWWNHWWIAQVLAKQNQHALARTHAQKALELGEKDDVFQRAFAEDVKKAMASWPAS